MNKNQTKTEYSEDQKEVIVLCRVSSKEQSDNGYSLEAQEKFLTEYANHKGLKVNRIFRITESASGKQIRKSFNEMLQYATKNGIKIILCEKIDRLTRNLKDAATISDWIFENEEREIHFVKENFIVNRNTRAHENLVWDMKVAIARFYTNNLSEEVKKGQKEKIAQGWLPTKPPLGYKTTGDHGHKIHIVDKEKAPFIKKMFELYSTGNYSVIVLVDKMYQEGLKNHTGKKVGKSRMYDLLRDPFFYGVMRWKGKILPAKHEALISKEIFDRVGILLTRTLNKPQFNKYAPVFKAKMTCGTCGGSVCWETHKGHWYGHCNGYQRIGMKEKCEQRHKRFWRQEDVEKELLPLLDNIAPKNKRVLAILEEALKESHSDEITRFNAKLAELNTTIDRSQRRLETIYEDKLDQKISAETYELLLNKYTVQKEEAVREMEKLNKGNKKYYEAGYAIHELASNAVYIYGDENIEDEDRRLLLSYAFSNIVLYADKIKPEYTLAFDFLRNWIPKVNSTLELEKTFTQKGQKGDFSPSHPILLRG